MQSIEKKIKFIRSCVMMVTALITMRLIYLQIILTEELKYKSEQNFLRWHNIPSLRGDIVDTHRRLLATNRPVVDLYWQASACRCTKDEIERLVHEVAALLEKPIDHAHLAYTIMRAEKTGTCALIAPHIDFSALAKIKEQYADHPNIVTRYRFMRYYPHQLSACHVIGYLNNVEIENSGKMGLEKLLNNVLKGESGATLMITDAVGKTVSQTSVRGMQPGDTVCTTLDLDLQLMAEAVFDQELSGSFILMDPATGALRVLVSRPAFDPSMFLSSITQTQWQELQERRPFLNRALDTAYPPGSIFKLVTISAALENEYIDQDSHWYCCGYSTFCGRRYYCHKREGHGKVSVMEAVAYSCNPLFFELGKQMDIDLIAHYATMFGLGKPTQIALSEHKGLIPTRSWKRKCKGESWWQGETLSAAIGQSFILATPMQVARMVSSIFTGYLVNPRILETEPIHKETLNLHRDTLDFLRASMRSVVTTGSGRNVSRIRDMEIYAKTATAQTSALARREEGTQYKEHGWFVCYVRYKHHPPIVIVVLIENIGSSRVATGVVGNFLIAYKKYLDAQGGPEKELVGVRMPQV